MKISRTSPGKYAEVKLNDGQRVFFSVLPNGITASTMFLTFPTKKIWEFTFPFQIRTALTTSVIAREVLIVVLATTDKAKDISELLALLQRDTDRALQAITLEHNENISIIEGYGEVLEEVGRNGAERFPAGVYPDSLLPYPREVIRNALESELELAEEAKAKDLRIGLALLDGFVDVAEADALNTSLQEAMTLAKKTVRDTERGEG